jgi:hypothetical protein
VDSIEIVVRIVVFAIGLALVVHFLRSIIRVALLNRHQRDRFAEFVSGAVWRAFRATAPRTNDQLKINTHVLWYWPTALFMLGLAWFVLALIAFACLLWAARAEDTVFAALIGSGSALTTLGFYGPMTPHGLVLAIAEGIFGLFILAFVVTFIPGYQATMQQRNDMVAWVYARTGAPPTGAGLLAWFYTHGDADGLSGQWGAWEVWLRDVGISQTVTPLLNYTRTSLVGQDWLAGCVAVLDAAALSLSALDTTAKGAAQVCLDAGVRALGSIAGVVASTLAGSQGEAAVTRAEFDRACEQLRVAGAPVKGDREQAWRDFSSLRSRYGHFIGALAERTLSVRQHPLAAPATTELTQR